MNNYVKVIYEDQLVDVLNEKLRLNGSCLQYVKCGETHDKYSGVWRKYTLSVKDIYIEGGVAPASIVNDQFKKLVAGFFKERGINYFNEHVDFYRIVTFTCD